MKRKITLIRKLIYGCSLISLLVFAAEIPDALPAGFLEQLPVMMKMDTDEYAAFLEFSKRDSIAPITEHDKNTPEVDYEN